MILILFQLTTIYSIFKFVKCLYVWYFYCIFDMFYHLLISLHLIGVSTTILKTITIKLPWICLHLLQSFIVISFTQRYWHNRQPWRVLKPAQNRKHTHTTRWPERHLEGRAFTCYVITYLQAYKADNSYLINSRVPGAALLTSRCRRQGHSMKVTSPLSNAEKPEIVIFCFRHSFCSE